MPYLCWLISGHPGVDLARQWHLLFEQAAAQLEPKIRLAKVNTETEQTIGAQYGIRSIPTLMLFQNGKEVAQQAGAMSAADIVHWVQTHL